jgi:uncharacterized protein YhbP (UPF0306 family)
MPVIGSARRFSARRIEDAARRLLDASTLCAIATVTPQGRAHVNTAYFAWDESFDLVWLSAPESRHSRNLAANPSAAVSVFDSTQTWGKPDRGIQLFGSARVVSGRAQRAAEQVYGSRFREYARDDFTGYELYRLKTRRVKLFDERTLGGGVFVEAGVRARRLVWTRTELYS